MLKTQNAAEYSSVSNTSQSQDGLVWLTGYIPEAEAEGFKKAAAQDPLGLGYGGPRRR